MNEINSILYLCLTSIGLSLFVMVLAANIGQILKYTDEVEE